MKSMWAAIFFMTCLYRAGGAMAPWPPESSTVITLEKQIAFDTLCFLLRNSVSLSHL